MAQERVQRRLAAILAADVVGYSRMMNNDESGTLSRLKTLRREIFEPKVKQHGGRIFKIAGDGAFVEFNSAVEALESAADIQRTLAARNVSVAEDQRIALRIGISLGDVIVEGSDLYGNGVNVASRMEGLAETGGICVSGNVHEHIGKSLDLDFEDLGERSVKNIDRPVRCYRVRWDRDRPERDLAPPLPDKPSVAVLPFTNMSGDADQEYFSDGITEDIITALSRIRQFFVIARNTTFTFKNRPVDVQTIARELGVHYVLEGSVRRAGNRVRVTAQLIDGASGNHLWAERYDRQLEDIFAVQDEITQTVVGAIGPELDRAERERALQTPPENLNAWSLYHRGQWHLAKFENAEVLTAIDYFNRAIEIDPSFAQAYTGLAVAEFVSFMATFADTPAIHLNRGMQAAEKAVALDDKDAMAYATRGVIHLARREHALAVEALRNALDVNPSSALAQHWLGLVYAFEGRNDEAIAQQEIATRLSPNDTVLWAFMNVRSYGYLHSRRFEQAEQWAHRSMRQPNAPRAPSIVQVIALSHLGRVDEARRAAETLREKFGDVSIRKICDTYPFKRPEDAELWVEGLRKAGVPEK